MTFLFFLLTTKIDAFRNCVKKKRKQTNKIYMNDLHDVEYFDNKFR